MPSPLCRAPPALPSALSCSGLHALGGPGSHGATDQGGEPRDVGRNSGGKFKEEEETEV